jgi:hypothetical protein
MNETARILVPFPVESRIPPQTGESAIVSKAGMNDTRAISEKEAPCERSWIGRKAQMIPVGPKANAVDSLTAIRWSVMPAHKPDLKLSSSRGRGICRCEQIAYPRANTWPGRKMQHKSGFLGTFHVS